MMAEYPVAESKVEATLMPVAQEWLNFAPSPRALSGTDKWNVFLSYRSVNRPWVLNLYDVLRELKHEVFLDQVVLKAGDRLISRLQDALATCQAGILIWTSAAQDSDWVKIEFETMEGMARARKDFSFVPIRLDRAELPLFAQIRIFLDFADYPDGPNGGELLRLLHAIVGQPLSEAAARFANEQDQAAQQAATKINAAIEIGNHERLVSLFAQGGLPWRISAALGCKAAEGLTKLGRNDEALHILQQLETQFPKAIRPKQLHALALARRAEKTGKTKELDEAQTILSELKNAGERDPETLGIFGRTWMDRYDIEKDELALRKSRDLYAQAFDFAEDDYYTGINAAAKSVLLGDLDKADEYAARVLDIVGTEAWPGDYWKTATVAEAFLMRKDYQHAAAMYHAAVAIAPKETGSHGTTWKQAQRLMAKLGASAEEQEFVRRAFGRLAQGQ